MAMTPSQTRIRDLELLLVLNEEGNMTRAATRVGISEPALSKQLRKLEQRLQLKLFERGNGGVVVTACGQAFMAHAYDCFHAFHRAVNDGHDSQFGEQQKLRIGASSDLSNRWLERLQSIELRSHRKVWIELVTGFTFDMLARVQSREIDVALVMSPPANAAISTVRVANGVFVIVTRKEHPLAGMGSLELRDVAEFPWVFFERRVHPSLYDGILRRMQEKGLHPRIRHHVTQADQAPVILREDSAVAWLTPAGAERIIGDRLVAIPLRDPDIQLEIHMATLAANKSPVVSEYVRRFVKRVEEDRGPLQLRLPMDQNRAP
jgi:DNA-binding transcriptional LysR family regulator